jgi:membrane-associated phospholipid phosphatase
MAGAKNKQSWHSPLVLGLLVVLLGMSMFATRGTLGKTETAIFEAIYSMPDSFRWSAQAVTQLGSVAMVIGVVGLLFVLKKNPYVALLVFRNSVLTYVIVLVAKFVVGRERPMILLSEVTSREMAVFGYGFPSLHAALATVVGLTLVPYFPAYLRWVPWVWIGLVAWSRIYLGVHAPLDIIGGFIIGVLVVLLGSRIAWPRRK